MSETNVKECHSYEISDYDMSAIIGCLGEYRDYLNKKENETGETQSNLLRIANLHDELQKEFFSHD